MLLLRSTNKKTIFIKLTFYSWNIYISIRKSCIKLYSELIYIMLYLAGTVIVKQCLLTNLMREQKITFILENKKQIWFFL